MGSIWHWIVVLVIALAGAAAISLVVWGIMRTISRSSTRPPEPPSD